MAQETDYLIIALMLLVVGLFLANIITQSFYDTNLLDFLVELSPE